MKKHLVFFILSCFSIIGAYTQNIQGNVWLDDNGNGIKELTETNLPGIQVQLYISPTNTLVSTIASGAGGNFSFNVVAPGDYYVRFNPQLANPNYKVSPKDAGGVTGWAGDPDNDSDANVTAPHRTDDMTFTVGLTEEYLNVGLGVFLPGSINGIVWDDVNGDGQKQAAEGVALMNVNVTLYDATTNNIVTTNADGNPLANPVNTNNTYAFNNLAPGDYYVKFEEMGGVYPNGMHLTVQKVGAPATDSDPDQGTGNTDDITIGSGDNIGDIDAGYYKVGQIGDYVWEDLNGNGVQDGGEPPLAGINVSLITSTGAPALDPDGNPITDVTNGAGNYLFDMVPPGTYRVKFELNPTAASGNTLYFTLRDIGGDASDSDPDRTNGETATFTITSGLPENLNWDAGYIQKCTIGNYTWHDINGNGIQDSGEPTIDVPITITKISPAGPFLQIDGTPYTVNQTSSGGAYLFDNLPPGEYKLTFGKPTDYFLTYQNQGANDLVDSDPDRLNGMTVNLNCQSGTEIEDIDAGYFTQCKIGNFVWHDEDGDGLQGAEPGLAGVNIVITNFDGTPVTLQANGITPYVDMQNSTASGAYQFLNLPPGRYKLTFTGPPNFKLTEYQAGGGSNADKDSDADFSNMNMTSQIVCNSEDDIQDIDAGFFSKATLFGKAWHDSNADGLQQANEPVLAGVTFTMTNANTGAPALLFSTGTPAGPQVTDASGNYAFNDINPGTYTITATGPAGWLFSPPNMAGAPDDNPDSPIDSDFDLGGNLVNDVLLKSNAVKNNINAGMYQLLTVGGTIWAEDDNNSMFGDPPANQPKQNVVVELCRNGVTVASTTSNNMGEYEFTDVVPGIYVIKIAASNFGQGQPLYGNKSCDGQAGDNDVDNDDNGEGNGPTTTVNINLLCGFEPENNGTENHTIDFCFTFDCGQPNPIAAFECPEADTICDLEILEVFCSRMPSVNGSLVGTPICGAGGTSFHNTSWFAFVAGGGNYTIEFDIFGCNGNGAQAGIYEDCSLTNPIICQPSCFSGIFSVPSSVLTPGKVYFFFLDGCNGSVCSYRVDILGDFQQYQIPQITNIVYDKPCNRDTLCPGTQLKFEVTKDYNEITATFYWRVTDPTNVKTDFVTNTRFLDYTFGNKLGTYKVEVLNIDAKCSLPIEPFSIEVIIGHPVNEDWGEYSICEGDFGAWEPVISQVTGTNNPNGDCHVGWAGGPILNPGITTINLTTNSSGDVLSTVANSSILGCKHKQFIKVNKKLNSKPYNLDTFLCTQRYEIMTYKLKSQVWPRETFVSPKYNAVGCDSIINLVALYMKEVGTIQDLGCTPQGYKLKYFQDSTTNIYNLPYTRKYTFTWIGPDGKVINDGNPDQDSSTIFITESGYYSLIITQKIHNSSCDFDILGINVNVSNLAPPPVDISGPTELCSDNTIADYSMVTSYDPNLILSYNWVVTPSTANIISGQGTPNIKIDWKGLTGGKVCASISNDCGPSPLTCDSITVTPIPVASINPLGPLCESQTGFILSGASLIPGALYLWNFDGGSPIGNTNNPGPIQISWANPGEKNVTLKVVNKGCESNLANTKVNIVEKLNPPSINCSTTKDKIEFTFNGVPGIANTNNYQISVATGQPGGVLTGNSTSGFTYTLSGLGLLETAKINLTVITNSPCGNLTASSDNCTTQNCDPPTVVLEPVNNICLLPTTGTIKLKATITPDPNGTYEWSGPGIVDASNGIFDPKVANLGVNKITLKYTATDNCIATTNMQIEVNLTPNSPFTVSKDIICITESVTMQYNGNTPDAEFNWTFGPGVVLPGSGKGPFDIKWNTSGTKTITLKTEKNNCESTTTTKTVQVDPQLEPMEILCLNQQPTAITVGFNNIANATNYTLFVNGVAQTINNGTKTFDHLGLIPDSRHFYEIVANSNNACPGTRDTVTCYAVSCPEIEISFSPKDTVICLNEFAKPFKIIPKITGGLGTGTGTVKWSGKGMTQDSVFNPQVAGPSSGQGHLITLEFKEGICKKEATMFIRVLNKPNSAFTTDDKICVKDELNINYSGSSGLPLDWTITPNVPDPTSLGGGKYKLKFPNPGTYKISLITGNPVCLSSPTDKTVVVEKELDPISITCTSTLNSVQFNWNDIDCASKYEVIVDGVNKGQLTDLKYLASGLAEGTKVNISVLPISDCKCPGTKVDKTCEAKKCPDIKLTLTSPNLEWCEGTLNAPFQLNAVAAGSNGTGVGSWSGTAISNVGLFNPAGLSTGKYLLKYKFTEENCDFEKTIELAVNSTPKLSVVTTSPDCFSYNFGTAVHTVTGGTGNFTYTLDGNAIQLSALDKVTPGNHTLVVKDSKGCNASTGFKIDPAPEPSIKVEGNNDLIKGQPTVLSAIITNLPAGTKLDSVVWKNSKDSVICSGPNCQKVNFVPLVSDKFCADAYYNSGCTVRACIDVTVTPLIEIILPNILSPDSDNNSSFFVEGFNTLEKINSLAIYDRWGNLVFYKANITPGDKSEAWDGRLNGKEIVPGVYVYTLNITKKGGKKEVINGDITVVK